MSEVATSSPLSQSVCQAMDEYFARLDGQLPTSLYEMVLSEVEKPLLFAVLKYTNNNQSLAAEVLGISRGTLRKKLKKFGSI